MTEPIMRIVIEGQPGSFGWQYTGQGGAWQALGLLEAAAAQVRARIEHDAIAHDHAAPTNGEPTVNQDGDVR